MSALLKIICYLSIVSSTLSLAEPEDRFADRVKDITRELNRYDAAYFRVIGVTLFSKSKTQEVTESYRSALKLIEEISQDEKLDAKIRSQYLLSLADACGEMFERLTEPFADVKEEPASWTEIRRESGPVGSGTFERLSDWVVRFGRFTYDRLVWNGSGVLRDFLRAWPFHFNQVGGLRPYYPFTLPFGSDWNRSRAANKIIKSTFSQLQTQLDHSLAEDSENAGLSALKKLIVSMETAEPIKWGQSNKRFRRFLFFIAAPYLFIHPPVDFWWFSVEGPTQYSLLVSSLMQVGSALVLGKIRRHDSGYDAYWFYEKSTRQLEGKPLSKAQKMIVLTRLYKLSKIPGLGFLNVGFNINQEYAKMFNACDKVAHAEN